MAERRFGYEEFGLGLLAGFGLGAIFGILSAPQSGLATRGRITDYAREAKNSAEELWDHGRDQVHKATLRVERALGREEQNLRRKLDEIRAEIEKHNLNGA